jgi:hypothetical protein
MKWRRDSDENKGTPSTMTEEGQDSGTDIRTETREEEADRVAEQRTDTDRAGADVDEQQPGEPDMSPGFEAGAATPLDTPARDTAETAAGTPPPPDADRVADQVDAPAEDWARTQAVDRDEPPVDRDEPPAVDRDEPPAVDRDEPPATDVAESRAADEPPAAAGTAETQTQSRPGEAGGPLPGETMDERSDEMIVAADVERLQGQWHEMQAGFVDDPRKAVEEADALIGAAMAALTARFESQRRALTGGWRDAGTADTEELRMTLQRYRYIFDYLVRS